MLATLDWVRETWYAEVGSVFDEDLAPVDALVELARRHAVYCRRDIARVMVALRVEFAGRDHAIGDAGARRSQSCSSMLRQLINAGRRDGSIPPGPSATVLAGATLAAIEGAVIAIAGRAGDDRKIARRVALGLLNVR